MSRIEGQSQFVSISELFRSTFRLYQDHLSLFWKVIIPVFILSLILDISYFSGIYTLFPNSSWEVSTAIGLTVNTDLTESFNFQFSSFTLIFAWFSLSLLTLTTYKIYRGNDVSMKAIWKITFDKKGTIFGTCILCIGAFISFLVVMLILSGLIDFTIIIFTFFSFLIYFGVRSCLVHQCIMIEDLSTFKAFLRSSEMVNGNFLKFFGRLFLLAWVSSLILNLTLAFTFCILSFISTDFVPIQEAITSEKFLTLIYGIPISFQSNNLNVSVGNISLGLSEFPGFWFITVVTIVKTFVYALLIPLWAILTTNLYIERIERREVNSETQAEVIETQI